MFRDGSLAGVLARPAFYLRLSPFSSRYSLVFPVVFRIKHTKQAEIRSSTPSRKRVLWRATVELRYTILVSF
jgi:hypothetical protein